MGMNPDAESKPAAFQGKGWQPRQSSLAQEITAGKFWARHQSNSEHGLLKAVLLHIPDPNTPSVEDVNAIQHLQPMDFHRLHDQMQGLRDLYRQLGVQVFSIDPAGSAGEPEARCFYNLVYARDLFFMTPEGAILSRMASQVRAGEELFAARALLGLGIPILRTVSGTGTFEGADAAWVDARTVLIGTGNRTNTSGFEQLKSCLAFQGVRAISVPLPRRVLHLQGALQIVDDRLAVTRGRIISGDFRATLETLGFRLIELDETAEVTTGQAMNFVTVAPRRVVMVGGNPETLRFLERNGIVVETEAEVRELLKGAGGLGCATGILHRQEPAPRP
jgi:N-dimethylarginine dimethylaminohydrolase